MNEPENFCSGLTGIHYCPFKGLLETLGDVVCMLGRDGFIAYISPSVRKTWGYAAEVLAGTDLRSLIHPGDHAGWEEYLARALKHRGSVVTSLPLRVLRTKDGPLPMKTAILALPGREDPVSFVMSFRHITGTAKPGKTVAPWETQFRNMVDQSYAGMYVIQDGVFKYVNPRFAQMMEYDLDEMIGMNWETIIHPGDLDLARETVKKRESGEIKMIHYEFRSVTRTGKILYVEVYGSRTLHEGRPAAIATILDITERQRMERALRDSEKRYRHLADNSRDMIWFTDPAGTYIYVSPSVLELRGYTQKEAMEQTVEERFTPESAVLALETLRKRARTPYGDDSGMIKDLELEYRCKDGSTVWVEVSATSVYDTQGDYIGTQGTSRNITERKRLGEALRKSEERCRLLEERYRMIGGKLE